MRTYLPLSKRALKHWARDLNLDDLHVVNGLPPISKTLWWNEKAIANFIFHFLVYSFIYDYFIGPSIIVFQKRKKRIGHVYYIARLLYYLVSDILYLGMLDQGTITLELDIYTSGYSLKSHLITRCLSLVEEIDYLQRIIEKKSLIGCFLTTVILIPNSNMLPPPLSLSTKFFCWVSFILLFLENKREYGSPNYSGTCL